ncbi:hypothetical protein BN873_190020 [Candidatus Competibacter denitrificans Run_A_D11]|uniref:Uncharacterized protein n=1 Tax=Candidatus Competibacter denitrificans Run_A_D11 TaxID=1400863 RepID=W6M2B9_9GAMM|nr:hypothetical protein BN873_190020 [Candidatus Competibacter denitrificans Run_A_D11]
MVEFYGSGFIDSASISKFRESVTGKNVLSQDSLKRRLGSGHRSMYLKGPTIRLEFQAI